MLWLLGFAVVLTGGLLAVQPLLNGRVAAAAGHPVYGALFSVIVSTTSLAVLVAAMRLPSPDLRAVLAGPAWIWTGGLIGACVVVFGLLAAPRLGVATTVALFIAGQLIASLLVDHHGWLGAPVHPIDLTRLLGVLCLVAGVALIRWV